MKFIFCSFLTNVFTVCYFIRNLIEIKTRCSKYHSSTPTCDLAMFYLLNDLTFLNYRTAYEWVNPASVGLVVVTSSEGRNLPYGRLEDILSRDVSALNCHTNDDKRAWFAIDLGIWFIPSAYTLRHARGYGRSALRNWMFQVWKPFYFDSKWLYILCRTKCLCDFQNK